MSELISPTVGQQPTVPSLAGFGYSPFPDAQPFSQRAASGYQESLEGIIRYLFNLNQYLAATNDQALWDANVTALVNAVDAALTAQTTANATAVANALTAIEQSQITITDPAILVVLNNAASVTRVWLDSHYVKNDATDIDAAVAPILADPTKQSRKNLDGYYQHDSAEEMQAQALYVNGDSFTQPINGETPAVVQVTADHAMTMNNVGVSSSFARDVAMRMIQTNPATTPKGYVVLQEGINMVVRHQTDGLYRKSEYAAIQASILLACIDSKLDTNSAIGTGTWADYPNGMLSGGAGRSSQVVGSKYTWPSPPYGYYFALGFTFPSGAGATANTGAWYAGTTLIANGRTDAPGLTALETDNPPYSASTFVPWPILLPVLSGGQQVQVEVVDTNFCVVDALYKLQDEPPMVAVVLPTRIVQGTYTITEQSLNVIRGDFRAAVNELLAHYPALRGRVVLVDPHNFGWDPTIHTIGDGLHPNTAGHRVIATAIEKTISRMDNIATLLNEGVTYPLDWLAL